MRKTNVDDEDEAGAVVNEESWYLGDGGFAKRYLNNEERISVLKVCPMIHSSTLR